MDKQRNEKWEYMLKYIPFIDFIIKVDSKKYGKFLEIKEWILNKKRYSLTDLSTIEQSIKRQYKNLIVINDKEIPQEIVNIFNDNSSSGQECINLCSDDEETNSKSINRTQSAKCKSKVPANEKELPSVRAKENCSTNDPSLNNKSVDQLKKLDPISDEVENAKNKTISKNSISGKGGEEERTSVRKRNGHNSKGFAKIVIDTIIVDSSDEEIYPSTVEQCKKRDVNANINTVDNVIAFCEDKQTDVNSFSALNNNNPNTEKHNLNEKKTEATSNNENKIDDFDISRVNSLSIEDLLNHVSQKEECDNNDLQHIILKSILTNIRRVPIQENHSEISNGPISSCTSTVNENAYDFQILTNHPKFKDPRIRKWFCKLKNSHLLAVVEKEMAVNLKSFVEMIDNLDDPSILTTELNQPTRICAPQNKQITCGSESEDQNKFELSSSTSSVRHGETKNIKSKEQDPFKKKKVKEKILDENDNTSKRGCESRVKRNFHSLVEETRSILLNTLQPYEEQIASVWKLHKNPKSTNTKVPNEHGSSNGEKEDIGQVLAILDLNENKEKDLNNMVAIDKSKAKKDTATEVSVAKNPIHPTDQQKRVKRIGEIEKSSEDARMNRIYKELECTFKGYDELPQIGLKRRSNAMARTSISDLTAEQNKKIGNGEIKKSIENARMQRIYKELECTFKGYDGLPKHWDLGSECNSSQSSGETSIDRRTRSAVNSSESSYEPRTTEAEISLKNRIGKKRRSSIYARSAINEQLNSESSDISDNTDISNSELLLISSTAKRRKATDNDFNDISLASHPIPKKRKMRIYDSDSECSDLEKNYISERERLNEIIIKNQPCVLLKRLTEEEIRKHINSNKDETKNSVENLLNIHLVASRIQPDAAEVVNRPSSQGKIGARKKLNNNPEMTENNTRFCTLCSSRPPDLTYHYVRKHKSESYVSRLTWSQLHNLSINTSFAELLTSENSRSSIYSVKCPFCDKIVNEAFLNLYKHFSIHTGEYAFQCSGCKMEKPFQADIEAHQKSSKTCRSSRLQTMYLYPRNATIIYMHYCKICNFVQLNKANVLKHLRDHHDERQAIPDNVDKCILVAIRDAPDTGKELEQPNNGQNQENLPEISQISSSCNNYVPRDAETNAGQKNGNLTQTLPEAEGPSEVSSIVEETGTELDLNLDDNIPVRNEACTEEVLDYHLEEQLKEIHTDESAKLKIVLPSKPACTSNMTPARFASKQFQNNSCLNLTEFSDYSLTPPRPSLKKLTSNFSSSKATYRCFPSKVNYLGLYKCLADDCYYSTDAPMEMLKHFEDHDRENMSGEYVQCAYCSILEGATISAQQLVDHIGEKHQHMIYQCSICCYRSCEASNVYIHQKESHVHAYQTCTIYKTHGQEILFNAQYIKEKIAENVLKLHCKHCSHKSFYHSNLLEHHMKADHGAHMDQTLKNYSCIYCPLTGTDENFLRKHIAIRHPDELPYVCDHNNPVLEAADLLHNLSAKNLGHIVPIVEINEAIYSVDEETHVEDVKPSPEELQKSQEETVKVRLRKLTERTGVAPDSLYRCPEHTCGGFFSIYDLWLRHMRTRHNCCECSCPHCPDHRIFSLTVYKEHFEEHRMHTYICFQCPMTFACEQDALSHAATSHCALGPLRLETIRFNFSYSYFVLIPADTYTTRMELIPELLNLINKRLDDLKLIESKKLKRSWLVSKSSTPWLDRYKKYLSQKLYLKCFSNSCKFRTTENEILFRHARENHNVIGTTFKCSQCDFVAQNCNEWVTILDHIKQHSEQAFFICNACSKHYYSRRKLSSHIKEEHAARDVPIIQLTKEGKNIYVSLSIIFANEHLSFSTLRNCFCCEERDMKSNAFLLHLKRYHKFVLNYFCEWCSLPIASLQHVEEHYKTVHTKNKIKIRCDLTSKENITVQSICSLKIHINSGNALCANSTSSKVKNETNDDDSVIILEDDDIVVQNYVKDQEKSMNKTEKPILKCIPMANLLINPTTGNLPQHAFNNAKPRIKIVHGKKPSIISNGNSAVSSKKYVDVASTTNPEVCVFNQQVEAPTSSRSINLPANNLERNQFQIGSYGNGSQQSAISSVIPNATKTLHHPQQVLTPSAGNGNIPQTNQLIQNQSGGVISTNASLPTTQTQHQLGEQLLYPHPVEFTPTYNFDNLHQVATSLSTALSDSTSNRMKSNQYEKDHNEMNTSQRLQNGRHINIVTPTIRNTFQSPKQIIMPSVRNGNDQTANTMKANQSATGTSGSATSRCQVEAGFNYTAVATPTSTAANQRIRNNTSIHLQLAEQVSQGHLSYSTEPTFHVRQKESTFIHSNVNASTSNTVSSNEIFPPVANQGYLNCAPLQMIQKQKSTVVQAPLTHSPYNSNTHPSTNTYAELMYSSTSSQNTTTQSTIPSTPHNTLGGYSNHTQYHTATSNQINVMENHPAHLTASYAMENNIPQPITGTSLQHTAELSMGPMTNIHSSNRTITQRSHFIPSTISGMANHGPLAPPIGGMRSTDHHTPAISPSSGRAENPTQQIAFPRTVNGITTHSGTTTNNFQHINVSSASSSALPVIISYAPTENNYPYQYIAAPMESTRTEFTNTPTFPASYTSPSTRY